MAEIIIRRKSKERDSKMDEPSATENLLHTVFHKIAIFWKHRFFSSGQRNSKSTKTFRKILRNSEQLLPNTRHWIFTLPKRFNIEPITAGQHGEHILRFDNLENLSLSSGKCSSRFEKSFRDNC